MKTLRHPSVHSGYIKGRPIHFMLSTLVSLCVHHTLKTKFPDPKSLQSHERRQNSLNFAMSICKHEEILAGYATLTSLVKAIQNTEHKGNIFVYIFISLDLHEGSIRDKINSQQAQLPLELQSKINVKIFPAAYPSEIPIKQWMEPPGRFSSCSNIRYFLPVILSEIDKVVFLNSGTTMDLSILWNESQRLQSIIDEKTKVTRNEGEGKGKLTYHPPRKFPGALILMDLSKIRGSMWQETLVYCPKTSTQDKKRCKWMTCSLSKTSDQCYVL